MTRLAPASLLLLLLGCAPEDRSNLKRQVVAPAAQSGWARVKLDAWAEQHRDSLWLSEPGGRPVPFTWEREGLWQPQVLETVGVLLGSDGQGHPTAEFALKFPEGWQVREREHLRLDLEVTGEAPWVARVEVTRRMEAGDFVRLDTEPPFHVYDLGHGRAVHSLTLPWDAERYRISLAATQGRAPKLTGLRVTACTWPEALKADETLTPRSLTRLPARKGQEGTTWMLDLPGPARVVATDLVLRAPAAPVSAEVAAPRESGSGEEVRAVHLGNAVVWNLPAIQTRATRVALSPSVESRLQVTLPEGAELESARVLVRRSVLLFPAEAGRAHILHGGGGRREAPGDLGLLPSSRLVYTREPLALGEPEADADGVLLPANPGEQTRPWLPWVVGGAVLVLGIAGFRLLKGVASE
jgi:hypothetical protein